MWFPAGGNPCPVRGGNPKLLWYYIGLKVKHACQCGPVNTITHLTPTHSQTLALDWYLGLFKQFDFHFFRIPKAALRIGFVSKNDHFIGRKVFQHFLIVDTSKESIFFPLYFTSFCKFLLEVYIVIIFLLSRKIKKFRRGLDIMREICIFLCLSLSVFLYDSVRGLVDVLKLIGVTSV
jgi:hypothetical protein